MARQTLPTRQLAQDTGPPITAILRAQPNGVASGRRFATIADGASPATIVIMKKIPSDDPRARYIAMNRNLDADALREHLSTRHQWVLATTRRDGRPQMSLVTGGQLPDGRLAVSTYPQRAKAHNARNRPQASVLVMGEDFGDDWIQVDGSCAVLDLPAAADDFVEYYRSISGEHPDWEEYRQAMIDQGKCLIVVTPERTGPLSRGGFPPELFED